jgi:arsenate reductase-like glutaredoxin family protein
MYNGNHQSAKDSFSTQSNGTLFDRRNDSVWQDKDRISSDRGARRQPASVNKVSRSQPLNSNGTRTHYGNVHRSRTEHLNVWVDPIDKAKLQRLAAQEGLSLSATTAAFLKRSLQEDVDLQYSALLEPIITSVIRKELQGISNRIASLLVRNSFDTNQTRALVTNILGKQPGMSEEKLKTILAMTKNAAKANLTQRSPEFAELIAKVQQFLDSAAEENEGERV